MPRCGILTNAGIVLFGLLEGFLDGFVGGSAAGFLNFAGDSGTFGGDFLPERGTVKLEEALDLIFGVVLVVDGDELFGNLIDVKSFFVVGDDGVDECLTFIAARHGCEQLFAVLLGGQIDRFLNLVTGADKFEKRVNIGSFGRINGSWTSPKRIAQR